MPRKFTALVLAAVLLLTLAACGGAGSSAQEEATPAPEQTGTQAPAGSYTYADAYSLYYAVCTALTDEVNARVGAHNARLESDYPDSYYMNSNYLMLAYAPFATSYPALGSALADGNAEAVQTVLRATFPDAALTAPADGRWEAEYTYVDKTSGEAVERQGRCVWEVGSALGSFRVCAYLDGELAEFTEFVPQGNDLYLLYTMTDKALVRYTGGEVTAIWHAHRISEPAQGAFGGDMRLCSLDDKDFFPDSSAGVSWITADPDAQYVLTLENGAMVYAGKIAQDIPGTDGERVGVSWMPIDPITLLS